MGKYTDIKSNFIKEKLKRSYWRKDKDYIDNLIFIEKSFTREIYGLGGNIRLHCLIDEYKKEFNEIFKELNPKGFREYLKREKKEKERKENKKWLKEETEQKERDKLDWIKAGGK